MPIQRDDSLTGFRDALQEYDELVGIDWQWQSLDGAMTKSPLGGWLVNDDVGVSNWNRGR